MLFRCFGLTTVRRFLIVCCLAVPSLVTAAPALVPNTEVVLAIEADGASPFSAADASVVHTDCNTETTPHPVAHTPGDDGAGASCAQAANGIVRTFDTVTYRVDWNVNELDSTNVQVSATLPALTPEAKWVAIPAGCDLALSTITNNDQTLTCVIGDRVQGSFGTLFPIAQIDGTRANIDGEVLTLTSQIDTAESTPVTSNPISVTISAAPRYSWVKGEAKQYFNVVNDTTTENGYVLAWPIQLVGSGGSQKGLAPLDDTQAISFYDHLFWFSSNTDSTVDATMITAANFGDFTGSFDDRVCGGYSGLFDEMYWDYTDLLFKAASMPFGLSGLGTASQTTLGAQASESISCTDVTGANDYPIYQIDITGHDTSNAAAKSNTGSGSNGAVITAQVVFWFEESELFPGTGAGNVHVHNVISGTTDAITAAPTNFEAPSEYGAPIVVAGSATGFETDSTDNGPHSSIRRTPTTPGPSAYRHYTLFHNGPYSEIRLIDPNHGIPFAGIDSRKKSSGGLGQNGTYVDDANVNPNNLDYPWGFNGAVSRNQLMTIEMHVGTNHNAEYADAHRKEIHGCLYIDNEYMDVVDFPSTFPITETVTHYEHVADTTIGPLGTGTPSEGLVHLLYGDHARSYARSWAVAEPVRLNPGFNPNYVVEVATAAVNVGTDYERGEVQCNNDDAAGGVWTVLAPGADLSAYDTGGDGRYEGIEMIRVRTLDPVPWTSPFPSVWDNRDDRGNTASDNFGAAFKLFVQTQVKTSLATAPNGAKLYIHAARAQQAWDGSTNPVTGDCTRGNVAGMESYESNPTGWCNLATVPTPGNADEPDPVEQESTTQFYTTAAHRDTTTIVGPRLNLSKTNAAGPSDYVNNDDIVTYNINISVTGSPTPDDLVKDVTITDTLTSKYDYISHTEPTDGSCTFSGSTLTCGFGDRIADWSDSLTITLRVKNATPNGSLPNTAKATGLIGTDSDVINAQSTAYAYTPGPFHEAKIQKQVPDLNGPCVHDPGLSHYGAASGDCSWVDIGDDLQYTLEIKNTGMVDLTDMRVIDVLPHDDDEDEQQGSFVGTPAGLAGTIGDGRQPETAFNGSTALVSVTSSAGGTVYYTDALATSIVRDPDHTSNDLTTGSTTWCTVGQFGVGSCLGSIAEATAFRVDMGTLAVAGDETIDIVMSASDNLEDDIYTNTFGARTADIKLPGRSNDVSIMVEQYDLSIVKALAATQLPGVQLGSTIDYVITIDNQGTVPSGEFVVEDVIPAGLSFVSATPAPDTSPPAGTTGTLTWTFSDATELAADNQQVILLTLQVDSVTQAPFRNWVEIASDSGDDEDSQPGDNSAADNGVGDGGFGTDLADNHNDATTDEPANDEDDSDYEDVFILEYDLALIKSLVQTVPSPATLGSQVTYMITVMNQGNVPSGAYSVADTIPAGMAFVSADNGGAFSGSTVTWNVPSANELPAGGIATFTVTTVITDVAQQPFRNNADIIADSAQSLYGVDDDDSDPTDNSGASDLIDDTDVTSDVDAGDQDDSDFAVLGALVEYDLALIKAQTSVSPSPAALGSEVTHTITVMNQGNVPSGSYTVDDLIPPGMVYVSATPAPSTNPGVNGTGTVQWVVAAGSELLPGEQTQFTIVTRIDDGDLAPYRNNAEITADSGDDNDSDTGDGSGASDTFDDNDVSNDQDPGDEDDSDFSTLSLGPVYDLALIKDRVSVAPSPPAVGSQVTYLITVMNQGDMPSGTYTVTDTLPAGLTFVSATPAATTDPGAGNSGAVEWVVPAGSELAAGVQTTFTLVAQIAADAASPLRNGAEITNDSGNDKDSDPTDNSGSSDTFDDADVTNDEDPADEDDSDFDTLLLAPVYDLALIKELQTVSPTPAAVGSLATYQITVMNQGDEPSGAFEVTDVIPAGMTFQSAVPAATSDPGVNANGDVVWRVRLGNELQAGEQAIFTLVVKIEDAGSSPYHNVADITDDSGDDEDSDPTDDSGISDSFDDHDVTNDQDPGDADDSDFADLAIGDSYDLALIKASTDVSPTPANHGSRVTYTITVMNQGTVPSGAFQVTDVIPSGMTFVSASADIATTVITDPGVGATGSVVFDVALADELLASDTTTFTVITEIDDVLSSPFRNIAGITADSGADEDSDPGDGSESTDTIDDTDVSTDVDPGDSDDSDFDEITASAEYDLALIKTVMQTEPTPATFGSQVTYQLTVLNQGNVPSGTYQVTDSIPTGMSFVSASAAASGTVITDPGVGNAGDVVFDVPLVSTLDAGELAVFTVTLKIDDVTESPFRNSAGITADSGAPYGGDDDSDPADDSRNTDSFDDSDVTNDEDPGDEDDSDFAMVGALEEYDLALIKAQTSVSTNPATVGTQVTHTITVMNQGNIASGTYTVDDLLPAGMGFVSATPAPTTDPGVGSAGSVQWVVSATDELQPGEQAIFTIVSDIQDVTQAPYRNNAEITADSGDDEDSDPGDGSGSADTFDDNDVTNDQDPNDEDDSDFSSLSLDPKYDLALIKNRVSVVPSPANVGSEVTYEIVVMNQGDLASGTYTVADALPAGLTFVSATPAPTSDPGVGSSGNVEWVIPASGELAAGAQQTFTLVAAVAAGATSPLRNGAEITADSGVDDDSDPTDGSGSTDSFDDSDVTNDEDPGDEDDSDFDELVLNNYDLALVKEVTAVSPSPAAVGSHVSYTITVMNQGGTPSGAYTVGDAIPAGMSYLSSLPAATIHPGVGNAGTVEWSVTSANELVTGEQTSFILTLQIDDAGGSPYHNVADILADSGDDKDSTPGDNSGVADTFDDSDVTNDSDPGDADDSDFADIAVGDNYDLALIKQISTVTPTPATHGSVVTYVLTVMNQGSVASGAFEITDVIPAGMTFVSASADIAATVVTDPGVGGIGNVVFAVPGSDELASGATTTFTIETMIDDVLAAPFHNVSEITDDSGADEDSDPNDGSGGTDTIDDTDVTTDVDANDSDDSDFADLDVTPEYDLALIKEFVSASPSPATLGSEVTFAITVMNQGNVPSGTYQVTDAIPAGTTFVSASATPTGTLIADPGLGGTGNVTFDVPLVSALNVGDQAIFTITLQIIDVNAAPFRNRAEISADSGADYGGDADSDPSDGSGATDTIDDHDVSNDNDIGDEDDSDFAEVGADVEYDLALIKEETDVDPAPAAVGSDVTYTITVMNQGNVASGTFTVDELIPAGMGYVSASPAPDTDPGVGNDGTVQWVVPLANELDPGEQTTFTVIAQIIDASQSPYRDIAEITADSGNDDDSDPGDGSGTTDTLDDTDVTNDEDAGDEDDSDFATTTLGPKYDLALIKQRVGVTPTPANIGSQVTYQITVMNQGDLASGTYTVTDVLPAGLTFVSASPLPTTNPGVGSTGPVEWVVSDVDQLASGAQATFTLVAEIAAGATSPLRNGAEITSASGNDDDSTPGDGSGSTDTFDDTDVTNDNDPGDSDDSDFDELLIENYDLAMVKELVSVSPSPAAAGSSVSYQITVMNQGGVNSGTYTVTDVLPAGMVYLNALPAATTHPGIGNNGSVEWVVPVSDELAAGAQATFTLVARIDDASNSPFRNEGEITADSGDDDDSTPGDGSGASDTFDDQDVTNDSDPGDSDDSDYAELAVGDDYDLALIKEQTDVSPLPANHGSQVTYTITVMNQGTIESGAFQVSDIIPAGMTFVSASADIAATVISDPGVGSNGTVMFDVPVSDELAAGAQTTFEVIAQIDDVLASPFQNVAEITADSGADTDSDPGDGSGGTDTFDDTDVTNDNDPGDSDDSDISEELVIAPEYDLALIKEFVSADPAPADYLSNITYQITVMNQGNVPSGTYQVTDVLPAGLAFVAASAAPTGTIITDPGAGNAGAVVFDVPLVSALDAGETATFTVIAQVIVDAPADYRNNADITADSSTPYGGDDDSVAGDSSGATDTIDDTDVSNDNVVGDADDSDFNSLNIPIRYDLALIKRLDPQQSLWIIENDVVEYDIRIKNESNVASGGFTIVDTKPAGMSFVGATGPGITCVDETPAAGQVQCTYTPPMANDMTLQQVVKIDLQLRVDDISQAPFKNWAEITDDSAASLYGVADVDSITNTNGGAGDSGPGEGSDGADNTIDENDFDDVTDNSLDEDDSDLALVRSAASTPITLQSFASQRLDDGQVRVDWITSHEDANQGFHLYSRDESGRWRKRTSSMIPTQGTDGASYSAVIHAPHGNDIVISDIDLFGSPVIHGPFTIGETQGGQDNEDDESDNSFDNTQSRTESETVIDSAATDRVYLKTKAAGVHRVSYEALRDKGFDFDGVDVDNLALTLGGEAVAIRVKGAVDPNDPYSSDAFGHRGYIEFIAEKIDSLYTKTNVYTLSVDADKASRIEDVVRDISQNEIRGASYTHTLTWEPERAYSRTAPVSDPWYAERLHALRTAKDRIIKLNLRDVDATQSADIKIDFWAIADVPSIDGDHHVEVAVNGVRIGDLVFDGVSAASFEGTIPAGVLNDVATEVTLTLPVDRGAASDTVYLDAIQLSYARRYKAINGSLSFNAAFDDVYKVNAFEDKVISVYEVGETTRRVNHERIDYANGRFGVRFSGQSDARYVLADRGGIKTPQIGAVPTTDEILSGAAQLLVIAHPRFIGDDLDRLVEQRRSEGLSVKVTSVLDVYEHFGHGIKSATAIKAYVKEAAVDMDTRYVLLVGGDTYDPKGHLKTGLSNEKSKRLAASLVPTIYAQTSQAVHHAPVDPLYGDTDDDGVPDLVVGRLPVQSTAELRRVIDKTLIYSQAGHAGRATFVSDGLDDSTGRSFTSIANSASRSLQNWSIQQLPADHFGHDETRRRFMKSVDRGRALSVYFGHSGKNEWAFGGLLRRKDMKNLVNDAMPTAVVQLGCWNAYYVEPLANTLSHYWLTRRTTGAALVMGASTLAEAGTEEQFGTYLMSSIAGSARYGDAILQAKRAIAQDYDVQSLRDLLGGFVLIGDPTLPIPNP